MAKKVGAKGKYETLVKPYLAEINEKVKQGVTEAEIAKALKISVASLNNYRNQHEEFREALSKDKGADVLRDLVNAGIEGATGGTKIVKKPIKLCKKEYENGKLVSSTEYVEIVEEEIYIPPNASLNQFYVLNYGKKKGYARDPLDYDLKKDKHEFEKNLTKRKNWNLDLEDY